MSIWNIYVLIRFMLEKLSRGEALEKAHIAEEESGKCEVLEERKD